MTSSTANAWSGCSSARATRRRASSASRARRTKASSCSNPFCGKRCGTRRRRPKKRLRRVEGARREARSASCSAERKGSHKTKKAKHSVVCDTFIQRANRSIDLMCTAAQRSGKCVAKLQRQPQCAAGAARARKCPVQWQLQTSKVGSASNEGQAAFSLFPPLGTLQCII